MLSLETHHEKKVALGCEVTLLLVSDGKKSDVAELFRQLWLEIFLFEARCSRFIPDSELSRFNRAAGVRTVVTPEFQEILTSAREQATMTDGLYNPFILPALQRAGYVKSMVQAHRDDDVDDFQQLTVVSPDKLEVGSDWARIPHGTAIDLGGCGKGFIADKLADIADQSPNLHGYWFSLGGDIVASGRDANDEPWTVGIAKIDSSVGQAGDLAGSVSPPGGRRFAVATSAITARRGVKNGKQWHHIIDPTTGKPADTNLLGATVSDHSCLRADVLASCCIILGSAKSKPFLSKQSVLGSLLQLKSHTVQVSGNVSRARAEVAR